MTKILRLSVSAAKGETHGAMGHQHHQLELTKSGSEEKEKTRLYLVCWFRWVHQSRWSQAGTWNVTQTNGSIPTSVYGSWWMCLHCSQRPWRNTPIISALIFVFNLSAFIESFRTVHAFPQELEKTSLLMHLTSDGFMSHWGKPTIHLQPEWIWTSVQL